MRRKLQAKLNSKKGFTLVELLVVVASIAILVAISIPMVTGALDSAKKATDDANRRAAEGAAMVAYLTGDNEIGEEETYYYDAESGLVKADKNQVTAGYNKSDKPAGAAVNATGVGKLIVEVTIDGEDGISSQWVTAGTAAP